MLWYSFCIIVCSVFQLTGILTGAPFSAALVSLSVGVFGLSVHDINNPDYERARQFRECYIKIKSIYDSELPSEEKLANYSLALKGCENHSDIDYKEMIFDSWIDGSPVSNNKGVIPVGGFLKFTVVTVKIFRFIVSVFLILMPLVMIFVVKALSEQGSVAPSVLIYG